MPNCKQHAATGGIHEVLTDDRGCVKVIADARLKLERDTAPAMPSIEKDDSREKAVATSIDASEEQSHSENTGACG